MSLTLAVRISATILDALNVQSQASCYALVDPGAAFSDVITFFNTWLADLDALTDGQIIGAAIHVYPGLPGGLKSSPVSTSRAMQTGILNFMATGSANRWGFAIPALSDNTDVQSGGKIVLTSGSPANTMYTFLLASSSTLEWSNSSQQLLDSFTDALIAFRKYNKQLAGLSVEV